MGKTFLAFLLLITSCGWFTHRAHAPPFPVSVLQIASHMMTSSIDIQCFFASSLAFFSSHVIVFHQHLWAIKNAADSWKSSDIIACLTNRFVQSQQTVRQYFSNKNRSKNKICEKCTNGTAAAPAYSWNCSPFIVGSVRGVWLRDTPVPFVVSSVCRCCCRFYGNCENP